MSKADEMFKEIKFEKIADNEKEVIYKYKEILRNDKCVHTILFAKVGKVIFSYQNEIEEQMGVGIEELQAINEKCKELGWLDE